MMTQRRGRKLSSTAQQLKMALSRAQSSHERLRLALANMEAHEELSAAQWRANFIPVLREIANLPSDHGGVLRFLGRFPQFDWESAEGYSALREQLRAVWHHSPESPQILNEWLTWTPSEVDTIGLKIQGRAIPGPFVCSIRDRAIIPNYYSLRGTLIQAVLANYERLKVCAMNDCPAPYFVAKRADQTVCDNGDCKAERQRQWALDHWRREGSDRRKEQARRKKPRSKT